jgi:hypothetical protein
MTAAPIDIPCDEQGPNLQLLVRKLGQAAAAARGEEYDPAHNPAHAGYPRITPAIWKAFDEAMAAYQQARRNGLHHHRSKRKTRGRRALGRSNIRGASNGASSAPAKLSSATATKTVPRAGTAPHIGWQRTGPVLGERYRGGEQDHSRSLARGGMMDGARHEAKRSKRKGKENENG